MPAVRIEIAIKSPGTPGLRSLTTNRNFNAWNILAITHLFGIFYRQSQAVKP
jgi:hypothetical protein